MSDKRLKELYGFGSYSSIFFNEFQVQHIEARRHFIDKWKDFGLTFTVENKDKYFDCFGNDYIGFAKMWIPEHLQEAFVRYCKKRRVRLLANSDGLHKEIKRLKRYIKSR